MAGRKAKVRYWSRKGGGFFTTIAGQQVELALGPNDWPDGPVYSSALAKFNSLRALETDKGTDSYLVSSLMTQYRRHLKDNRQTYPTLFDFLTKSFVKAHGKK